ncbi:hypothetical protein [Polyangium fumosum]|uniref:Uncharacterized protein n=1 Tax=Polyangium fumosum TaxID=889272 RepID=A0A4U1IYM8_9BACT|nr:hypothetical protein [Polyangium fumosum]TKC99775.1 hypothetical protein E8A74_36645 [Polyangium fumosum]
MSPMREFELYLMSLMTGKEKVESVLASLGSSVEAMEEAAARAAKTVGFFELIPRELPAYVRFIGPPLDTTIEPGIDDNSPFAGSVRHRFHLPTWPDFDFILRTDGDGSAWGPEFIRAAHAVPKAPARARELLPWTFIEREVRDRFGPYAREEAWEFNQIVTYVEEGGATEIKLTFDLALLQQVDIRRIG